MTKNNLKFRNHNQPEFINELRGKVKNYFEENNISKYGNAHIIVKSIVMISLYLIPYILMLTGVIYTIPLIIISWMIMGIGMAGVGMVIMHDANHRTYSRIPAINLLLSKTLYLLGGFPPNWRQQHNTLHHGFTNIEGHDDDINTIGLLRFSPHKPLYKIHKFQQWYAWFFYGLMTLSWSTIKDFMQLSKYTKMGKPVSGNKKYNYLLVDLILSKILYHTIFLIIPIILIPISWYWTVLAFLMMHFITGLILGAIFQTAHVMPSSSYPLPDDNGNIENNWAIHQLLTTSDYSPGSKVFSWLIGGLNYQVEHHLFPNISHVHYKNISPLVKDTAEKYKLPYFVQPNFFLAVTKHFQMLKMLGR